MALSGSFYTTGYSGGGSPDRLIFEWTATQDIATNKSTITWTVKAGGGWSGYYNTLSKRYIKVGNYQVTKGKDYLDSTALTIYNNTVINDLGGTTEITHNQDGTGSFSVDLRGMFQYSFVGNNYVYNSTGSATFTLDTIPRKATITSAPNFTDLDSPIVAYQNPAGSVATLRMGISFDGTTDSIAYRSVPSAGGSYTFEFTSAELSTLRNASVDPTTPIYFLLETTIGSNTFYDSMQKAFSVADTEDSKPTLTPTVRVTQTINLLPMSLEPEFIQNLSKVRFSISASGQYSAEIISSEVIFESLHYEGSYTGQTSISDTVTTTNCIESSGTIPYTIRVTDSRGHTKEVTGNISVIPYLTPCLIDASVVRCDTNGVPKNDGRNLKIKATRSFSPLTVNGNDFGKARIDYRHKRASESWGSQSWTTLLGNNDLGNHYEGVVDSTPNSYDETVAYTIQLRCFDYPAGNSFVLEFDIPTEAVVLHLREGGNGIGIGKYCTASGEMQVAYKAVFEGDVEFGSIAKATLLDMFYPIGTIYTSTNSTSPATFLGGTWTQIEDTFLLAAGQNYTAGATGGETEHTLTIDEMPSHDHISKGYMTMTSGGSSSYHALLGDGNATNYSVRASGGGQAHNNMPPYLVVYVWERTA